MMHIYVMYIILQPYRNRPFDSNTRKPNISLMIIIDNSEAYWVSGIHAKIFVLNISIASKSIHIRILILKSIIIIFL